MSAPRMPAWSSLTARERRVFMLAAREARTVVEIAEKLGIADGTVRFHLNRVLALSRSANQPQLVRMYHRHVIARLRRELRALRGSA